MQISDAMGLGRTMGRRLTADLYIGECHACAIGMAELAVGFDDHNEAELIARWPWLSEKRTFQCPFCSTAVRDTDGIEAISHVMAHVIGREGINGYQPAFPRIQQNITFDQLIDWVRNVEPPEPAEPQSQQPSADDWLNHAAHATASANCHLCMDLDRMVESDRDWSANTR